MKKKLSYAVKVILEQTGEVRNTHCECPGGMGPHATCKHVVSVLFVLIHFISTKEIVISKSCTETLQSFHQPKRFHLGSPVKAENLGEKKLNTDDDDPRPIWLRNRPQFNDEVKMKVINFSYYSGLDISFKYLIPKADLNSAAQDHFYLDRDFRTYQVDEANKVNDDEATEIELETRQQSSCPRWKEERKWRLTASNFGLICKATDLCNHENLCKKLFNPPILNTLAVIHGKTYESTALKQLEELTQQSVQKCGLILNPQFPFLGASPDGLLNDTALIEIKCPYKGRQSFIQPNEHFPFLEKVNDKIQLK